MIGLLLSLVPFITSIESAGGLMAAIDALSFAQKLDVGIQALAAGPDIMAVLEKLGPAFETWMQDLALNKDANAAAVNIGNWIAANQPATISGYGPDGSRIEIPNPDYKG